MGRSRYEFTDPSLPHFMTVTVLHWIPVFTRPDTVNIVLDSLRHLSAEGLKVYAYVILENHLHLVAQSPQLDRDMARFKSYTAKQLIVFLGENNVKTILDQLAFYKKAHKIDRGYQFWQEGVHPELIQSDPMMRQKVDYIHQNPVKRGYVDKPEHWRYSSARNYAGEDGLLDVCKLW
ncbi:transposase [Methylobacter sp.]|uniref:REP-associated tyrosine transposase n=1 Tax=Methylobacter sp. TaxID=2051955 RepID=UPI001205B935|nr:transposase [Methylobacter sp.]TAK64728.1 MAG: transposase [Methylobacter sp.]